MIVKKVVVDRLPKNCIECPLSPSLKKDCGEVTKNNVNGGVGYSKKPDGKCKLITE